MTEQWEAVVEAMEALRGPAGICQFCNGEFRKLRNKSVTNSKLDHMFHHCPDRTTHTRMCSKTNNEIKGLGRIFRKYDFRMTIFRKTRYRDFRIH